MSSQLLSSVFDSQLADRSQIRFRLQSVMESFFARRSVNTREAYKRNLKDYARYIQVSNPNDALLELISSGQGTAHMTVMGYVADMKSRDLSSSTINQRLSTLKSMLKLSRQVGICNWELEVEGERVETLRDTKGVGTVILGTILTDLKQVNTIKAIRDYAIFRMLYDLALRRTELSTIDVDDIDPQGDRVKVKCKGGQIRYLTLPEPTQEAITRWLEERGSESGPLFYSMDRSSKEISGITSSGIYKLLKWYGKKYGVDLRPHGVRHTAITQAVMLTNGNIPAVAEFARHKDFNVTKRYIDNLDDQQGKIAKMVAGSV